jgi:Rad3-related DNA helicase
MMEKIINSIRNSENALLESPTGTGKTLALLVAALAWQKDDMESNDNASMIKGEQVSQYFTNDNAKVESFTIPQVEKAQAEKKSKTKIYFAR